MATSSSSLPLKCSVCPKRPNFSDVSHLLTHVASKGHLSHYYKIKVRASHDLAARSVIDGYDAWYDEWNVEELMSQRMHQKEQKRSRARNQATAPRPQKRWRNSKGNPVDPELPQNKESIGVKAEEQEVNGDLEILVLTSPTANRPRLYLWDTGDPTSHVAAPLESQSPIALAHVLDRSESVTTKDEDEATKLKGAIWPGMDIFDSATLEMRRKRNQKKDVSVLDQLEQNSLEVEPTEVIYQPFGFIRKQRRISGKAESSSPLPEELPPPPTKRRVTARPILADKNVNSSSAAAKARSTGDKSSDQLPISAKSKKRKTKPDFVVHRDQDDAFGQQTGMHVLNSAFQPSPSHTLDDTTNPSVHNGHFDPSSFVPYVPPEMSNVQHMGPCFPHIQYGPANMNFYGPFGYDIAAFLAQHLPTAPLGRSEAQHAPWKPDDTNPPEEQLKPVLHEKQTEKDGYFVQKEEENGTEEDSPTYYTPVVKPMFEESFQGQVDGLLSFSDLEHEFGAADDDQTL